MNYKKFLPAAMLVGIALVVSALFVNHQTKANPSHNEHHQTATATTTLAYLKAESAETEHATTTLSFLTNGGDTVKLLLSVTPSTTLESVLRFRVEHSPNNQDWYGEDYVLQNPNTDPTNGLISNSSRIFIHSSSTPDHFFRPAPTSTDGVLDNNIQKSFDFPILSDYMRFVFSARDGSNNLGLWADAVVKIQDQ